MFESLDVMLRFDFSRTESMSRVIFESGRLFLTGEGSSRIFPAKNFIRQLRLDTSGLNLNVTTEGCYQALEYDLSDWSVVVASNSGQTGEAVRLYKYLFETGHDRNFVVTANPEAKLFEFAMSTLVLSCGAERAVAATKSVVEQALVYLSILHNLKKLSIENNSNNATSTNKCNDKCCNKEQHNGAEKLSLKDVSELGRRTLSAEYDLDLVKRLAGAETIYFAGRNDGTAEELSLKASEITRKRSVFLEGTYLLHGVEEVITSNDVVVLVDPFKVECDKIDELFVKKHNIPVIAISNFATPFVTIEIPKADGYDQFLQLFAGWNLLVQIAIQTGINLDKPVRARKIGNKFEE
jgi:glucosamine--fructose-6-phosphate aminotransferase (isomerizing)